MAVVISITNQKGGVGKTTTAIELSACLSTLKKRVLLVDFDQQANLSKYVEADLQAPGIYKVLHAEVEISEAIQHLKLFDVITSSDELSKADREFVDNDDFFLLDDVFGFIKDQYDYIIVDNSPSRNVLLTMAYVASDYVIVPSECDDGAIDGIIAINKDIVKLREGRMKISHAHILGMILTKKEKTTMHALADQDLEDIASQLPVKPFVMHVRKSIVASSAKKMGQSILEFDKSSNPAKDYMAIAKEVIKRTKSTGGENK